MLFDASPAGTVDEAGPNPRCGERIDYRLRVERADDRVCHDRGGAAADARVGGDEVSRRGKHSRTDEYGVAVVGEGQGDRGGGFLR